MSFIETPTFPVNISYGSRGGPTYLTDVLVTKSGYEDRYIRWTEARHGYEAAFGVRSQDDLSDLIAFFHAVMGRGHEFRYKDWADYKSSEYVTDTITATDQVIGSGDGTTAAFQLVKKYTKGLTTQRDIKKPVSGTVVAAIGGIASGQISTDTTTGIVTFDNITKTITGAVSSGTETKITVVTHGLADGDSVYLSTFTGDWAALNGSRYAVNVVNGNEFLVTHDSSSYTAYSSNGGQLDTLPQSGESVTAGFEFDVPCRLDTDRLDVSLDNYLSGSTSVPIVEVKL